MNKCLKSINESFEKKLFEGVEDKKQKKFKEVPDKLKGRKNHFDGDRDKSLKEDTDQYIYLFPTLANEDKRMLKAYNLTYLGANHGVEADENNSVVRGTKSDLVKYGDNYLGYELHPAYLYKEDEFAGDILNEDTIKVKSGKWVNKGKEGTHGEFRTKKTADAQRKAMFAKGYSEELKEEILKRGNALSFSTLDELIKVCEFLKKNLGSADFNDSNVNAIAMYGNGDLYFRSMRSTPSIEGNRNGKAIMTPSGDNALKRFKDDYFTDYDDYDDEDEDY